MLCKVFGILFCPPVNHISVFVVVATLVVEAVSHFMTDYYTNSPIVVGIIGMHIEEGAL